MIRATLAAAVAVGTVRDRASAGVEHGVRETHAAHAIPTRPRRVIGARFYVSGRATAGLGRELCPRPKPSAASAYAASVFSASKNALDCPLKRPIAVRN